jgi:hypothetical protein
MRKFAAIVGVLMLLACFTGLVNALDPLNDKDAEADPDRDNLTNWEEYQWATDPNDPDTDGAGCHDGWEANFDRLRAVDENGVEYIDPDYHFNPVLAEDEGFVANKVDLVQQRDADANVNVNDPDGDGWNNYHEFLVGSDPTNPNTDGDIYPEDSTDPNPLIEDYNEVENPGGGNGGGGSGQGQGMAVDHAG